MRSRRLRIGSQAYAPYLFLAPTLVLITVFAFVPVGWALWLAFCEYPILRTPTFIGIGNFTQLIQDYLFIRSVTNTFYYMAGTVPTRIVIGLIVALLLNRAIRGQNLLRAIYFFPVIAPLVTVSLVWMWIYDTNFGILNYLLHFLGFARINWLSNTKLAMPAIMLLSIWKTVGWNMLIFLAGLQGIPSQLYEAAKIDGSGNWECFRYITLPLLKPVVLLALVISTINSSQVFDQVYVMTGGGPGYSTMTLVQSIYETAFENYKMGYASSMAFVLFTIIMIFTIIQFKTLGREVRY